MTEGTVLRDARQLCDMVFQRPFIRELVDRSGSIQNRKAAGSGPCHNSRKGSGIGMKKWLRFSFYLFLFVGFCVLVKPEYVERDPGGWTRKVSDANSIAWMVQHCLVETRQMPRNMADLKEKRYIIPAGPDKSYGSFTHFELLAVDDTRFCIVYAVDRAELPQMVRKGKAYGDDWEKHIAGEGKTFVGMKPQGFVWLFHFPEPPKSVDGTAYRRGPRFVYK